MHDEAVSPDLLNLLRSLMVLPEVETFALGGGTSLALRFGHRKSIDIDLFTETAFDSSQLQDRIHSRFPDVQVVNRTEGSLCAVVRGVKVDFLLHPYRSLAPRTTLETIRVLSLADLCAMKVNAVTGRGSKKDFTDLLLLHDQGFSLQQALDHFCSKYGEAGRFLAIRSLNWFQDAEEEPDPFFLGGWSWPMVYERMTALAKSLTTSQRAP